MRAGGVASPVGVCCSQPAYRAGLGRACREASCCFAAQTAVEPVHCMHLRCLTSSALCTARPVCCVRRVAVWPAPSAPPVWAGERMCRHAQGLRCCAELCAHSRVAVVACAGCARMHSICCCFRPFLRGAVPVPARLPCLLNGPRLVCMCCGCCSAAARWHGWMGWQGAIRLVRRLRRLECLCSRAVQSQRGRFEGVRMCPASATGSVPAVPLFCVGCCVLLPYSRATACK